MQAVDIVRCRFSAFAHTTAPYPVYSPLDDIERSREGSLGDYNYVEHHRARSALMALPYWGSGWYSRELCQDLLEQRIVRWPDITHRFDASARMPSDFVEPRLRAVERCWGPGPPSWP